MPASDIGRDPYLADRKRAVRARMRAVTRVIAADQLARLRRSEVICEALARFLDDPLRGAPGPAVMVFRSWRTEVDLSRFIAWGVERAVRLYAADQCGDELVPRPFDGVGGPSLDPRRLDVVVVPGLAFTPAGHRLGRGGGHYDRFLVRLDPACLRVGVCFREQLANTLPVEPHDAIVDHVVSD